MVFDFDSEGLAADVRRMLGCLAFLFAMFGAAIVCLLWWLSL